MFIKVIILVIDVINVVLWIVIIPGGYNFKVVIIFLKML
jgi:hypothetical protein